MTVNLSEELRKHRDLFEENPNQNNYFSENIERQSARNNYIEIGLSSKNTLENYNSNPDFQEKQFLNDLLKKEDNNYDFCADHIANIYLNENLILQAQQNNYTIKEEQCSERYRTEGDFDTLKSCERKSLNKNYSEALDNKSKEGKLFYFTPDIYQQKAQQSLQFLEAFHKENLKKNRSSQVSDKKIKKKHSNEKSVDFTDLMNIKQTL